MNYYGYLYLMVLVIVIVFIGFTKARPKEGKRIGNIDWQEGKFKVFSWLVYGLLAVAVAYAVWSEI